MRYLFSLCVGLLILKSTNVSAINNNNNFRQESTVRLSKIEPIPAASNLPSRRINSKSNRDKSSQKTHSPSQTSQKEKKEQVRKHSAEPKDGAPVNLITPPKTKAVPKAEPLSRYGNPDSYKVKGRSYHVLKQAKGYKMRGVASWYGSKFHRLKTSSGERYDMYAMTAAHKTLPLPTYVRVKNLQNGRSVIVKVNDRGPFCKDRLIDLSYAAGSALGFLNKGTTLVEVEALTQYDRSSEYFIQAGAFNTKSLADTLKKKLEKLTTAAVRVEKQNKQYIVRVGPIKDKNLNDYLKHKLIASGITGVFSLLI